MSSLPLEAALAEERHAAASARSAAAAALAAAEAAHASRAADEHAASGRRTNEVG